MEVVSAARRRLLATEAVRSQVGDKVWKYRLEDGLETSSGKAIVCLEDPGWATPVPDKTIEFPTLVVDCYADPTRDGDKMIRTYDAEEKALALARVVKDELHMKRAEWWGAVGSNPGLMVVRCTFGGWRVITSDQQHASEKSLGALAKVRASFLLQVSHPKVPAS